MILKIYKFCVVVLALLGLNLPLRAGTSIDVCAFRCDAPVLVNPGNQSNDLTVEYGYAQAVIRSRPLGYWRLEDSTGSVATDWSFAQHQGTIVGGVARSQAGASGGKRTRWLDRNRRRTRLFECPGAARWGEQRASMAICSTSWLHDR
jgi:hypothetical protein